MNRESIFLCLSLIFTSCLFAQDNVERPNTIELKAGYFELGGSIGNISITSDLGNPFINLGGTLIWPDNTLIGMRFSSGTMDAPLKPFDYKRPIRRYYTPGSGNSGGNWLNILPNFSSQGEKPDEPTKKFRILSIYIGHRWKIINPSIYIFAEAGPSIFYGNEAVKFEFVSAYEISNPNGTIEKQTEGYTFTREEYTRFGGNMRSGLNVAFSKGIGMCIGAEAYLAPNEWIPGLFAGLIFGIL